MEHSELLAEHHQKAAEEHDRAAKAHRDAAMHHTNKDLVSAITHTQTANQHRVNASFHADEVQRLHASLDAANSK